MRVLLLSASYSVYKKHLNGMLTTSVVETMVVVNQSGFIYCIPSQATFN